MNLQLLHSPQRWNNALKLKQCGISVLPMFILEIRRQTVDSAFSELQTVALTLKESLPHCDNVFASVRVPLVFLLREHIT